MGKLKLGEEYKRKQWHLVNMTDKNGAVKENCVITESLQIC
jgi:hypothetical protein